MATYTVDKLETHAATMYLVKMENETIFKILTIQNGEVKSLDSYEKG